MSAVNKDRHSLKPTANLNYLPNDNRSHSQKCLSELDLIRIGTIYFPI